MNRFFSSQTEITNFFNRLDHMLFKIKSYGRRETIITKSRGEAGYDTNSKENKHRNPAEEKILKLKSNAKPLTRRRTTQMTRRSRRKALT